MKKILLVEKDSLLMDYTSDFLKGEGFSVITCSNSKEGIKLASKIIPDAIISDINMPDSNEFEICKAMKSLPSTAQVPVIYITERPMDIQKGMQIGADDFLPKPFSLSQMLQKLRNIFDSQPKFITVYTSK